MPFVSPELFAHLLNQSSGYDAIVPVGPDSRLEPLCAAYSQAALGPVTRLIEEGKRKVSDLFERVATRIVAYEEISGLEGSELFFLNINTPDDYLEALGLIKDGRNT
jgi:molybdopterin-guanine dinucleotide biosynthesis protein A